MKDKKQMGGFRGIDPVKLWTYSLMFNDSKPDPPITQAEQNKFNWTNLGAPEAPRMPQPEPDPVSGQYNWMNNFDGSTTPAPVNPNAPKTYDISAQTGYNPQNALNNGQVPVTPAADKNAIIPQKKKFDPYFALRGFTTGLSWLANKAERNRQDQYMYNQYSTLGQLDPANLNDYQPTPYNQYFQKGGVTPITVNNPNDPRLRAYQDSLNLYNNTKDDIAKLMEIETHGVTAVDDWANYMKYQESLRSAKGFYNLTKLNGKRPSPVTSYESLNIGKATNYKKPVQPVVYKKDDQAIITDDPNDSRLKSYQHDLDVYNYHMNRFNNGVYYNQNFIDRLKKPVPIIYQKAKEPTLQRMPTSPMEILRPESLIGSGTINSANVPTIPQQEGQYRVEYTDPETGQRTHRDFPNEKQGSAFQQLVGGDREGYWLGFHKKGGWIQGALRGMRKDKPCTGEKFGSESCPPGSKRYNLAKTFRKMAKNR